MENILNYISENQLLISLISALFTFILGILINPFKNKIEISKNSKEVIRKINLNSVEERNDIKEILKEFKENENLKIDENGSYLINLNNSIFPEINAGTYGVINQDVGITIKKADILLSNNVNQTLKNLSDKYKEILTNNSQTINKKTYANIEDRVRSINIALKKIEKFPFLRVMQLAFLGEGLKKVTNTEENQKLIQEIEILIKQNE
ncbi:hypothetical protein, partial [Staphylococcus shinii]|uniref:hypothetical protein n=1 Tax=Staphylococcus shinii TaxID=2912228 RepID=UPI003F551D4B